MALDPSIEGKGKGCTLGVSCPKCNKIFSKNSNLKRHLREKHEDKEGKFIEEKQQVHCVLCNKVFKRKEHLKTHMDAVHCAGEEKQCSFCNYTSLNKSSLSRHIHRVHKLLLNTSIPTDHTIKPLFCSECKMQFKLKKHLNYHLRKKHGYIGTVSSLIEKKCPLCSFSTKNANSDNVKQNMYNHFDKAHNIALQKESLEFESLSEFNAWKSKIEGETIAKFVKSCFRTQRKIPLVCHRSGKFNSKSTGKRSLNIKGSSKINGFCPAAITADKKDCGKVHVEFLKTHVGHEKELKHVSLTTEERSHIAAQLGRKMSYEEILSQIRSSKTNSQLKRIHLVTKKDIYNINKSFNLDSGIKNSTSKPIHLVTRVGLTEDPNTAVSSKDETNGRASSFEDTIIHEVSKEKAESEGFIETADKFINDLIDTLRSSITNIEELKAVKDHCKTIKPILESFQSFKTASLQSTLPYSSNSS